MNSQFITKMDEVAVDANSLIAADSERDESPQCCDNIIFWINAVDVNVTRDTNYLNRLNVRDRDHIPWWN